MSIRFHSFENGSLGFYDNLSKTIFYNPSYDIIVNGLYGNIYPKTSTEEMQRKYAVVETPLSTRLFSTIYNCFFSLAFATKLVNSRNVAVPSYYIHEVTREEAKKLLGKKDERGRTDYYFHPMTLRDLGYDLNTLRITGFHDGVTPEQYQQIYVDDHQQCGI